MTGTLYGLKAAKIEEFGGLCTLEQPSNLPPFMSPDCSDVEFYPGLVKTRPGLTSQYDQVIVGTFTGTATYTLPDEITKRFLAFAGTTFYKDVAGVLTSVSDKMKDGDICNYSPAFGRMYMAFGDGKHGVDIPRQYNDTNFDRVSQVGPGRGTTSITQTIVSIDTLDRTSCVTDVVLLSPYTLEVGDLVTISGADDASFNGTFPVCSVTDTTHFSYFNLGYQFATATLTRLANVVTVVGDGTINFGIGSDIVIVNPDDPTFDGRFTGTGTMTYAQVGPDATTVDGTCYALLSAGIGPLYSITQLDVVSDVCTLQIQLGFPTPSAVVYFQPTYAAGITVGTDIGAPVSNPAGDVLTSAADGTVTFATFAASPDQSQGNIGLVLELQIVDDTATGGIIGSGGHISSGVRQVAVSFITREGYITKPSPPFEFVGLGNRNATLNNLPIGPPNVIGRLLMFTAEIVRPATRGAFFSIESTMQIDDNTTETWTVDFTEAELLAGTPQDYLFNLVELGECSAVINYASRMLWCGERAKVDNFLNLTFDGGFNDGPSDYPLGWTPDSTLFDGGGKDTVGNEIFGEAYEILGDGVTDTRGLITQPAFNDYLGNPIIRPSVGYSVRVKLRRDSALARGTLRIDLHSPSSSSGLVAGLAVPASQVSDDEWIEFTAALTDSTGITTVPADLVLRVYADDRPTNNAAFYVENIEVFVTELPYNGSIVRASGVESPDDYNGVDGFLQPDPNNGQEVRNFFTIRNFLYLVKESSLYVTQSDGQNEPAFWGTPEVSNKVGTLSSRGVGIGEEWVLIAGRDGVYYFDGSEQKISQEIQPTWDAINWNYGHLIRVTVDTRRKRAYIAVPYGTSTTNDRILTLDFTQGFGDPIKNGGVGRKWCPWLIPSGCIDLIELSDGTLQPFIGQSGMVSLLDTAALTDNGAKIYDNWQTGFFQETSRLQFAYLTASMVGSGLINITMRRGDQNDLKYVRGWNLSLEGSNNLERQIQYVGQRMALKFASNGTGDYFSLQGMAVWIEESAWARIRGINS